MTELSPRFENMPELAEGLMYYAVFLFSTTLHEAAHAWAALRGGDRTAYHGGQVSLDPIPHIRREPFGMVVLPLITAALSGWPFGFASAPYDPQWAMRHPRRAAWMALAGPAANLLLVVIGVVLLRVGVLAGVFHAPDSITFGHIVGAESAGLWDSAGLMLGMFISMNLLLAVFNLIPLPPLDGSGAIPLFFDDDTSRRYQHFLWTTPGLGFIGLFVAWQLINVLFDPLFFGAANFLYPGVNYE